MPIKAIYQFPRGFLWGCSTAAHQVEGQNTNDWWRWEQTPGHIFQNQRSGRTCDWWTGRYEEDFDRAVTIHNSAHRLSIEWSRIEPEPGKWDDWALDHYREMLKALRDRGLTPMVTLHHFTNPLWVDDHQGWWWDEAPMHFERFVRKAVSALGDLCTLWCTINEPMVYVTQSYVFGMWPPGIKNRNRAFHVAVNLLRGHAAAYHAIKELQPQSQVGWASHHVTVNPGRPPILNRPAVHLINDFFNRMFVMTIRDGVARTIGIRSVNIPQAKGALDWVGLQYYQEFEVGFNLLRPGSFFMGMRKPTHIPVGPGLWGGLNPGGIYDHIKWLWLTLKKPIYITEAGVPDPDDRIRPGYLVETLRAVWTAVNFNFPVRGFFFWSLLDNFEWAEGYNPQFNFGLYRTNFETQERIARPSAHLYGEICAQNGLSAATVEHYTPDLFTKLFPGTAGQNNVKLKVGTRTPG